MEMPSSWKVVGASARGESHIKSDLPCQDHHSFGTWNDTLVAIVCDGAGSASHSDRGARMGSEYLTQALIEAARSQRIDIFQNEAALRALLETKIQELREQLPNSDADSNPLELSAFHATLVGLIFYSGGGFFFHIGDGAALALNAEHTDTVAFSAPENGEFSDQTYFYTMDNWKEHLRITPIDDQAHTFLLMSDGTMPFCLNRSHDHVEPRFFQPVNQYLVRADVSAEMGSQALLKTLSSDRANSISKDDKTLVWATAIAERSRATVSDPVPVHN
jgi:hypothetical protein